MVQVSLSTGGRYCAQGICAYVCIAHNELAEAAFEVEAQDNMEMQQQEKYVGMAGAVAMCG